MSSRPLAFLPREFKGSRLRCLLLTQQSSDAVAHFFSTLVAPDAVVAAKDRWAPRGFLHPEEAKLGRSADFLEESKRKEITEWWLKRSSRANTPNWDLVSTCSFHGRRGMILVEAKAHEGEMKGRGDGSGAKGENAATIADALTKATDGLNLLEPGFCLSVASHFQLSNRFAFAWKLASLQIPVALVYLGFVQATEMHGRKLFRDHSDWHKCVLNRSQGVIPIQAWDRTFDVNGTPLIIRIRSAEVRIEAKVLLEQQQ